MERIFRLLRADEIDCRIGVIKENGLSLLLYKDARCDMNILDETFGPFGWQRHHSRDNANCIVSIFDIKSGEWVEKEDTGTESNTEAEKGLASDSFKRACFNWGIGRELYTAPFIWIPSDKCEITVRTFNGKEKLICNDKFEVVDIGYSETGTINKLVIANISKGVDVYNFSKERMPAIAKGKQPVTAPDGYYYCEDCGSVIKNILQRDGSAIHSEDIAKRTLKEYGKQLCYTCAKKRKDLDEPEKENLEGDFKNG